MRSPQSLTQRVVPALAVTVVATLLFGAVVVTADVASGEAQNLPATFGVAQPMQGDAWRYNLTLNGDWTFGLEDTLAIGEAVPFGTYQWAGQATVRGPDGLLHDVNRLQAEHLAYRPLYLEVQDEDDREEAFNASTSPPEEEEPVLGAATAPYWTNASSSGWVLAGAQAVLSRGDHKAWNDTEVNYGVAPGGPALLPSYEQWLDEVGYTEFPDEEIPCLAFNLLQGANVSLDQPLALLPACQLGGALLTIPEGLLLQAAALENRSGVQTIRFDGQLNGTYQVWFTPSVPYPVRLEVSLPSLRPALLEEGDRDLPGDRSFALEMTGFAPGNESLDMADDPADRAPLPGLQEAPPVYVGSVRVGPSEEGVTHPFPLSEAFRQALNATELGDLAIYLAAYPLSYVAAAEYMEGMDVYQGPFMMPTQSYDRVWRIGLTDGKEYFGFAVAQQSYDHWLPADAREEAPEPVISGNSYEQPRGNWMSAPYPGRLPDTVPTVRSLMDRWAAFDGSGLEANAWGFLITCDETDGACRTETTYSAGYDRHVFAGTTPGGMPFFTPWAVPGNPYGTEETIDITRRVDFDASGTAAFVTIQDHRHYKASINSRFPVPVLPPIGQARDPGYTVQSVDVAGIPPSYVAWLPEPKQAAQITFLGLAVGFLYWIWPKLGMVGLFSRLHKSELLDHPARARLVQIVESQPGIHFHDLAAKAELANGTAVHHLRKLSDSGHINVRRSGRYTCYFPGGRVDPAQAAAAPLLKSDGAKQVLDAVRGKPGMSNLELAQATGLQPSTVNYHVQRLANAGLVAPLRDGRNVRLHPGARAGSLDMPDASGAAA